MKCEGYRILITGYIDGELSDREIQMLKMHVNECRDCLHYLQRQEKMQMMLKRYSFMQEAPKVPEHFASTVTERIHETLQETRGPSFIHKWAGSYRRFAFRVAETTIHSLKIRPLAWTASMSSALLLLAGVVFFGLYHYSSHLSSPYLRVQTESEKGEPILVASVTEDEAALLGDMDEDSLILFEDSESPVKVMAVGDSAQRDVVSSNPANHEHIVKVASRHSDSVEEYVYSHVMEVYQQSPVDDAVLVGYVQ